MNIIQNISNNLESLSTKQKIIAKYLIQNKDKIGFMTLKELSEETNVTEVTIINFCKSIRLESFTEMRKQFQELIKKELHVPTKMKTSLEELENLNDAFNNTVQIQKLNFDKVLKNNNVDTFQTVSSYIENARTVYICGLGVSKVIVDYLSSRLKLINIDVRILEVRDMGLVSMELSRATADDCFILISFPSYSHIVINLSKYLSDKEYKFIVLTDSEKSPLAKNANVVLKSYTESQVFYNFISATVCLIELLLVVICFNMKDKIMINLEDLDEIQASLIKDINND
ncbi:MurR/RpiR family transcriptional regulator [Sporosalibacterium faouarense]|uniref:MurR/RpiR family transcriptional regulator n=1 Tax=Sporosalibacterium faouarense TaxID=516123 RepID=UPI00192ACBAB|nr:MurR/RpiR family transcriptional regulator [Sporosalibacterium faouarense]